MEWFIAAIPAVILFLGVIADAWRRASRKGRRGYRKSSNSVTSQRAATKSVAERAAQRKINRDARKAREAAE